MSSRLPFRRITRTEVDTALLRGHLRTRAEQGDQRALVRLMHNWPDYAYEVAARIPAIESRTAQ